jgi:hypothetical protein
VNADTPHACANSAASWRVSTSLRRSWISLGSRAPEGDRAVVPCRCRLCCCMFAASKCQRRGRRASGPIGPVIRPPFGRPLGPPPLDGLALHPVVRQRPRGFATLRRARAIYLQHVVDLAVGQADGVEKCSTRALGASWPRRIAEPHEALQFSAERTNCFDDSQERAGVFDCNRSRGLLRSGSARATAGA